MRKYRSMPRAGDFSFDPVAVGRSECDAWAAYYRREWRRFLRSALAMVRSGFALGPLSDLRGAWYVLRANQVWAPYPDNDPDAARRSMAGFYRLTRRAGRLDVDPARVEKAADQQNRADRDEDVFAEEESDVVCRGSVRAHVISHAIADLSESVFGGGFGHRRDERTHHLRMAAERREAERRGDLADREVREQQASRRRDVDACHQRSCALLEACALEHADDGQRKPHDGDRAAFDERFAEGGNDLDGLLSGGESRRNGGAGDDEERIQSKGKADDDDQNANERKDGKGLT